MTQILNRKQSAIRDMPRLIFFLAAFCVALDRQSRSQTFAVSSLMTNGWRRCYRVPLSCLNYMTAQFTVRGLHGRRRESDLCGRTCPTGGFWLGIRTAMSRS